MRFTECATCFDQVEVVNFYKKGVDWYTTCPNCGSPILIDDIGDFLLPMGTKVQMLDGRTGIIDGHASLFTDKFEDIEYRVRIEGEEAPNNVAIVARRNFQPIHNWRLTERTLSHVVRVCHHPKNQDYSNVPCYNCSDAHICFKEILERLAQYEDTGLLPEEIEKIGEKVNLKEILK